MPKVKTDNKQERIMSFNRCRFCKSKKIVFQRTGFGCYGYKYQCICQNCNNGTDEYADKDSAFQAWNEENK